MLESALALIALILALLLRPWRQLLSRRPLVTQSSGDASGLWTPLFPVFLVYKLSRAICKNLYILGRNSGTFFNKR